MSLISKLPTLNALLNSISGILLLTGFWMISTRRIALHRICMVSAFVCSILFLTSYVIYHYHAGSTPFQGEGLIRPVYFFILSTHVLLAAAVPVLAILTLYRAVKQQWPIHRKMAKWTFPIWLYVSVSGVVIYWMLYHLYR